MKSKPNQLTRAAQHHDKTRQAPRSRIVQASACGLIGTFLWALPNAQAQTPGRMANSEGSVAAPATASLPSTMPVKLAANGAPLQLSLGMAAGAARVATAHTMGGSKGPNCSGEFAMQKSVQVPLGKSALVSLPEAVRARTVGNPQIVQAMLVSPNTLYLVGGEIGTTNMIVQGRSGSCSAIDVAVGIDPAGLQQALAMLMPEETGVRVAAVSDTLVLSGIVSDSMKAERVVDLANAFADRQQDQASASNAPASTSGAGANTLTLSLSSAGANNGGNSGNTQRVKVINMMHVTAPQQVMLEVKVAEVDKTLIDQLGAALNITATSGSWSFNILSNLLSGGLSQIVGSKANTNPLQFGLDAQKTDQLTKILAEPNLMAISGQEASFLAGGKVFIPVPQSNVGGVQTIVLQEEEFGVGLTFTPTVLGNGRINLKVAPEVSELSPTGVTVTASGSNNSSILPLITTRRASTTVQLNDGQSFAIGGLLKSNITGTLKAIPGVGELPIIGALARDTNYESDKTELIFVITPRIVKPLPPNYPLPTDHFGDVNEAEVYATGNMEGHLRQPGTAAPATATPPAASANPAPSPATAAAAAPAKAPEPAPTQSPEPPAANAAPVAIKPVSVQTPAATPSTTVRVNPEPPPAATTSSSAPVATLAFAAPVATALAPAAPSTSTVSTADAPR
jgi:pilus assembly protein CpaC